MPTQFHTPLQSVDADNDKEFVNSVTLDFFSRHVIILHLSCPYTSRQNDKAERAIRTIHNVMRTLLFQAQMPPPYWTESLTIATYILNRLPTTLLASKTPFEQLFNKPPTYNYLSVFGCLYYPNMASTTTNKLSPCSTVCVPLTKIIDASIFPPNASSFPDMLCLMNVLFPLLKLSLSLLLMNWTFLLTLPLLHPCCHPGYSSSNCTCAARGCPCCP